jgi:hypothetical protein
MLRIQLLVALSLAVATPGTALAQESGIGSAETFAPRDIVGDDPVGKGFNWNKTLPCGVNHATLTLRFKGAYPSGDHMPVAKVWLHSAKTGSAPEQWIAAVLKAPTDVHNLNALEWLERVEGSVGQGPGLAPADLNGAVQLEFSWTSDGTVSVDFGDNILKHVTANAPLTDIGLSVSWAKFEFIGMKVGRVGAPDPKCSTNTLMASVEGIGSDHGKKDFVVQRVPNVGQP